jgi:hypothetical protein
MRYRCSSCGQVTESPVELGEPQLAVQACIACGAIGSTTYWPEADVRWWIGIRGERHGPYVVAQLEGMIAGGRLSANSYVWGPNFSSWARAGTLPEFATAFARVAPAPASPPVAALDVAASTPRGPGPVAEVLVEPAAGALAAAAEPSTSAAASASEAVAASVGAGSDRGPVESAGGREEGPSSGLAAPSAASGPGDVLEAGPTGSEEGASSSPAAAASDGADHVTVAPVGPGGAVTVSPHEPSVAEVPAAPARPSPPPVPPAIPRPSGPAGPPPLPLRSARVALDDARRPPPTRFGLPVVVPVQPEAVGSAGPSAPVAPSAGSLGEGAGSETRRKGLTRLTPRPATASAPASSDATLIGFAEPVSTRESLAVADGGLGEDFFAGLEAGASGQPGAHQGSLDRDLAELGGLFQNAGPVRVREPSRQEMQALRQEFSVVARLERHKRKRVVTIALLAAGLVGLATVLAIVVPSQNYFANGRGTSADGEDDFSRPQYDVPKKAGEAGAGEAIVDGEAEPGPAGGAAKGARARGPRKPLDVEIGDDQVAGGSAAGMEEPSAVASRAVAGLETAESRAARIRNVTSEADPFGKTEVALGFDSREAARKAEAAAAERKSAVASEQAEKVSQAFAAKLGQFKRCSTEPQEKVRVIFTLTIHGKVTSAQATGTSDVRKKECIVGILRQAVFPTGDTPQTFSQTITL